MEARPLLPAGRRDMARAVARECLAVRNAAGMFDASTLGKIEVAGPDAGGFLERIYTGDLTNSSRALPLCAAAGRGRLCP